MKVLLTLILIVGFLLECDLAEALIKDCTGGSAGAAKLGAVTISNCTGDVCKLVRGTNASVEVDFESTSAFQKANIQIFGEIGGIPIPFFLNPSDACSHYGFDCPVKPNEKKQLKFSLPILRTYPKLSVTIKLRMLNERQEPIICVRIPAVITDAL